MTPIKWAALSIFVAAGLAGIFEAYAVIHYYSLPSASSAVASPTPTISTPIVASSSTPVATPASVGKIYWVKITDKSGASIFANTASSSQGAELFSLDGSGFAVTAVNIFELPSGLQKVCTVTGSLDLDGVDVYAASAGALHNAHMLCGN